LVGGNYEDSNRLSRNTNVHHADRVNFGQRQSGFGSGYKEDAWCYDVGSRRETWCGKVQPHWPCHHTSQPAAEAAKHPPLKTAWPADRTTTLTAELVAKDANAVGGLCRDCHSRADTKPKLLPEIPQIKLEVGTEIVTLNNQQAFHRNCAGCHDEIVKTNKDLNPPTSKKCIACHKRTAA
jgi:hypothetical protein